MRERVGAGPQYPLRATLSGSEDVSLCPSLQASQHLPKVSVLMVHGQGPQGAV